MPIPVSEADLITWLEQAPENNRALFVLAAAVHSAINPEDEFVQYSGSEVVQALAKRERYRLRRIAEQGEERRDPDAFARIVAMAAIADGLSLSQASNLIRNPSLQLGFPEKVDIRSEMRLSGILAGDFIPPPKPDIVAAAFVIQVLGESPELAPEFIWAALELDFPGGLRRLDRLSYDAEVMLKIGEPRIRKWLEQAVRGNRERCAFLEPLLSAGDVVSLGWLDAATAACQTLLDSAVDDDERAGLLNNLSVRLSDAGDNPGALEAIREAVEIRRRLAGVSPARYEPDLAGSLNNLSNRLSDVGDNPGALEAIRGAVEIYRRLAAASPARYEPYLATSLGTCGIVLRRLGKHPEACAAFKEGAAIIRPFAQRFPGKHAWLLHSLEAEIRNTEGCG